MKYRKSVFAAAMLALLPALPVQAAVNTMADVVFVVDESGSMSGEHAWLGTMVGTLNSNLVAAGVTGGSYALVGFGGGGVGNSGRTLTDFTTPAAFSTATGSLVISGSTEDGYAGINYALNNLSFRAGAALNVVLVTDEDRDNTNAALTYASVLASLTSRNALLNAVVNGTFLNSAGAAALGHDSDGNAYVANGAGGYTISAIGTATGTGNTIANYYNMALGTGGAAWNLNQLRAGGNTAASFTQAFVDIKVGEIIQQPPSSSVPDAGSSLVLLVLSVGALMGLRRRMAS